MKGTREPKIIPENERYLALPGWPLHQSLARVMLTRPQVLTGMALTLPAVFQFASTGHTEKIPGILLDFLNASVQSEFANFVTMGIAYHIYERTHRKLGDNICIDRNGKGAAILGTVAPDSEFIGASFFKTNAWLYAFSLLHAGIYITGPAHDYLKLFQTVNQGQLEPLLQMTSFNVILLSALSRFRDVMKGNSVIIDQPPPPRHKKEEKVPDAIVEPT